jgi:hypothetical protein
VVAMVAVIPVTRVEHALAEEAPGVRAQAAPLAVVHQVVLVKDLAVQELRASLDHVQRADLRDHVARSVQQDLGRFLSRAPDSEFYLKLIYSSREGMEGFQRSSN